MDDPNRQCNSIEKGIVILLGIHEKDIEADADYIVYKILNTRMVD